jgi:hypothetical protein
MVAGSRLVLTRTPARRAERRIDASGERTTYSGDARPLDVSDNRDTKASAIPVHDRSSVAPRHCCRKVRVE